MVAHCIQPERLYLTVSALLQKIMLLNNTASSLRKRQTTKTVVVNCDKPLIILSSILPDDLFTNKALVVPCKLNNKNQIETCLLLNIVATGIGFIDKKMARHVCHILQILFFLLAKPKLLKRFDGKLA